MKPCSLPGCYPLADGLLIGGRADYPPDLTRDVLAQLAAAGVRSVIHLLSLEQFFAAGPEAIVGPDDGDEGHPSGGVRPPLVITYSLWPLADHALPSTRRLCATLDAMDHFQRTQPTVLVHGAGNPRRAAIAAGCWLARRGFGDPTTVKGLFRRLDRATGGDMGLLLSLSDAQRDFIYRWPAGC